MGKIKASQLDQDLYNEISQRYTHALAQSMMNTKANTLQTIYATNTIPGGVHPSTAVPVPLPRRNPNDCEAYVMPLSSLVNLWRAKYGDKWVDVSEIDDEFWSDASARLHKNKMMEESDMNNEPWARLRENA